MLGKVLRDIRASRRSVSKSDSQRSAINALAVEQRLGGRILSFNSGGGDQALDYLIAALLRPLRDRHYNIETINLQDRDWYPKLNELLGEPVWFAVSFFSIGQDTQASIDGRLVNLWEAAKVPFFRFYGDLPAYFPMRHVRYFRNSVNGYFHQAHAEFYRRWFPNPALSVALPPAIIDPTPLQGVDVKRKLKGKVIFPKNGNSPSNLRAYWRSTLPPLLVGALEAIGEESISIDWIDSEPRLDERLVEYFAGVGLDIAAEREVLCFLCAQMDDYIRRVKSTMVAESLRDLPIIIRGRNWDHVDFRGRKAIRDSDFDVARTLDLIDQAPALVDMSPNTQRAPHDRVCRAVGRGTAFLTNAQEFLAQHFSAPERFSFSFRRDSIRACVEHYVCRPQDAIDLGLEQAEALRKAYSDDGYVDAILTAVEISALRMNSRPPGTQDFVDLRPSIFG